MPEPLIHTADESGASEENSRRKLGEMYPGNTGDVLTRNAAGEYQALPPVAGPGVTGRFFEETLTVLSTDVLSQLSYTPILTMPFLLFINPVPYTILSGNLNVVGKTVNLPSGGYPVLTTMKVVVQYYTNEALVVPNITSFVPTSASVGGVVTITGTGFNGVQSVVIGSVAQTNYVVNSATQITVTLVSGTYSGGNVVVTTASGTDTETGFTYLDPTPTISLLSTTLSAIGNEVVITGTNFTSVMAVRFGGVNAASFVVNSATQITAVIADTGAAGTVQVQTVYGTATSAQSISLVVILAFPRVTREMTANTTVLAGVTYTASGNANNAGQEPWRAFTLNSSVFYFGVTAAGTEYLQLDCSLKFKESSYTLFTANLNTNHIPKTWVYEAWNGSSWVQLDSRTNQTLAANTQYDFPVTSNAGYYSQRRIRILATQLAGWPPAFRLRFNP